MLDATGMRIGELEQLTWGDVDEPRGRWRVSASSSKSGAARWIAVPPLFEAVMALVPRDDRTPEQPVFQGFGADKFRTAITRACTAAAVPTSRRTISGTGVSRCCTWLACRGPGLESSSVTAISSRPRAPIRALSPTRPNSITRRWLGEMSYSPNLSPTALNRFARVEIEYEVRMLLEQFGWLELRAREVSTGTRKDLGADGQALLEAVLVHLRLLDAFLSGKGTLDDVHAGHWISGWTSRLLGDRQRDRVNAKVAHLAARRMSRGSDWQPDEVVAPVVGVVVT